jgi:hypothetical protein
VSFIYNAGFYLPGFRFYRNVPRLLHISLLETKAKETRSKVIIGDVAESIETKLEVCCHGVRQWFLSIRPSRPSGALAQSATVGCMVERRNVATGMPDWQLARCLLL